MGRENPPLHGAGVWGAPPLSGVGVRGIPLAVGGEERIPPDAGGRSGGMSVEAGMWADQLEGVIRARREVSEL
jgi:hypothetical protein